MFICTVLTITVFIYLRLLTSSASLSPDGSISYAVGSEYILAVIACVLSFVAVIAVFIFIIPEKKRSKLNRAGRILHDIFNFRSLITEKICQGLYIFHTVFVIMIGFLLLFYSYNSHWMGGYGILVMFFGPIIVRLIFECDMLVFLLVKNVISINNKLRAPSNRSNDADRYASNRSYNADRYGNSRRHE